MIAVVLSKQTARRPYVVAAWLLLQILGVAQCESIRIDFGNATGRSDTKTPGWPEWQVEESNQVEQSFGTTTVALRVSKGTLKGDWYKASLASGATMAADGVVVNGAKALEFTITGLAAGRHSLVTYHNGVDSPAPSTISISHVKSGTERQLQPTHRATDNESVTSGYFEFEVADGEAATFQVTSADPSSIILNGLEIDGVDPQHKARRANPSDLDWHADADDGTIRLAWQPATSTTLHRVYHAAGVDSKAAAQKLTDPVNDSDALVGETSESSFELKVEDRSSLLHHCWRVDSIDADGKVTRGDIWSFRCRQLAFPSAEGYGRFAIGGRGGKIYKVTNLNDSGEGSLREALEADEPRTVIFDVGGRIHLDSRLTIRNPFLTIAGQTAPGKGICISNFNLGMMGAHDVIIRHIRVRPGDTSGQTLDGMGMASSDHCIIDHCSISWSHDEAFSSRGAKNITLQRTLISEALNIAGHKKYKEGSAHGFAASISGGIGSFHHNLLAHCAGRNWSLAGGLDQAGVHAGQLDIRNNVVYNWDYRTTDGGARQVVFENNYYKPGPVTRVFHLLKPERNNIAGYGPQDYYVAGNVMEGKYDQSDNPREGIVEPDDESLDGFIMDKPFFPSYVTIESAEAALESVLADVGCTQPVLDEHDQRVIQEARDGTTTYVGSISGKPGIPDSQEDVGGWDDYPMTRRDADWDSDNDGLPNAWETSHGLNPSSPAGDLSDSHGDADGDGLTNLENYLDEIATGA